MASPANFRLSKPAFHFQINPQRKSPQNLSFPLFSRDLTKSTPVKFPVVKASSSSSSPSNPKPSLLKNTCITLTAAAALFTASSFYLGSIQTARTQVTTVEEASTPWKHLEIESNDVEALVSLTKIKFESKKYDQAIEILHRLIEIDPNEPKWPVMRARILSYDSKTESAIEAFEEILLKDPNRIDAYHYLVMEYYDSKPKLTELEKRIKKAIKRFEKKNKSKEIRDLKVLIAQIRVIEGNLREAIRICEEEVKDDPGDFRVYMFQGLVYSMMKKGDEAMKQFEEAAKLIPDNHPSIVKVPMNANANTNMNMISEWRVIVAYDDIYCYFMTFTKLFIASAFEKFKWK